MEVGEVRTPENKDFQALFDLADNDDGWTQSYNNSKKQVEVWTRNQAGSRIQMIKVRGLFPGISAALLYDVLHDSAYRSQWDSYVLETKDICYIDPMNDICYYSLKLQPPLRSRDFVLQRSWLFDGNDYVIFNHSINHASCPPKKDMIRAISHLTGFIIRPVKDQEAACHLTYVSHSDPKGSLPTWLINAIGKSLAPKQLKVLQKACRKYDKWKLKQKNPNFKPWLDPEQLMTSYPKINWADIQVDMPSQHASNENLKDGPIDESKLSNLLKAEENGVAGDADSDEDS
jgi:hypothetical protein